jgi:threonine aldolase
MRSFASDNNSGVHPLVWEALRKADDGHAVGYGDDPWTNEALSLLKQTFGSETESFVVLNGTGGNILSLQLATRPFHSIICSDTAHILVDECGAPVKATGCPIFSLPTPDGKLTPALIRQKLHGFGDQHHSQPGVVYISQCTELGTVYTPEEVSAISDLAHQLGLYVHMDGARLANAAAALGCSLKALTSDCGVDILSFGGTKNGLMMGECVVVFHPDLQASAVFVRKQSAQLASKMRYLSAQLSCYLKEDLWLVNANHANSMARLLHDELSRYPEIRFTQQPQTNALFLTMPRPVIDALSKDWFFYFWSEARNEIRLVCSFDTTKDDVLSFLSDVEKAFINNSL